MIFHEWISRQELFFEAEDIAPRLNSISIARVKGVAHMAQQRMGDFVNRGDQQSLNSALLFGSQGAESIPLAYQFYLPALSGIAIVIGRAAQIEFSKAQQVVPDRKPARTMGPGFRPKTAY